MSTDDEDTGSKPHDPTPKRLEDARKKGQIPRSQDMTTAAAYLGLLIALLLFGSTVIQHLGLALTVLVDQSDQLSGLFFTGSSGPLGGVLQAIVISLAPLFLLPAICAAVSITIQRGFLLTGENLQPKLSRISPISNAKQKFGRTGLFEFSKSALKLIAIAIVLGIFLTRKSETIVGLLHLSPGVAVAELGRLIIEFLMIVVGIMIVIASTDYVWQYFEHLRRNRMSHKELKDETKDSEGDPHMKGERRRRGMDIATNRMLADVPDADVIIVNPTHYAVALKWSREKGAAPTCVAKGTDEIAGRIREVAMESGVPIHRDPPTARALHASVEIGNEIHPDHYRAVAAAIRFAERLRKQTKSPRST